MNARVELPPAHEVCPTTTRRLLDEGAQRVDVRELPEVAQTTFDVPGASCWCRCRNCSSAMANCHVAACWCLPDKATSAACRATCFRMYRGFTQVTHMQDRLETWARKGFPTRGAIPFDVGLW